MGVKKENLDELLGHLKETRSKALNAHRVDLKMNQMHHAVPNVETPLEKMDQNNKIKKVRMEPDRSGWSSAW